MLLEFILNPLFTIFESIVAIFPTIDIPIGLLDGLDTFLEIMNNVNYFFPISYIFLLMFGYWSIVNAKLIMSIITWVYEKIPFI